MCGHIHHEGQDVAELKMGMDVCFIEDRHQRECAGVFGSEVGQIGIFVEDADFEAGRAGEVEVKEDLVGCHHVVLEVDGVHQVHYFFAVRTAARSFKWFNEDRVQNYCFKGGEVRAIGEDVFIGAKHVGREKSGVA